MSLLLKALKGEASRPPIWMMRQTGRYLPSYQALRKKHSLWTLFHDSSLAAEVTLLPFASIPFDAAIVFSDILVILEAFGALVHFPETGGPKVEMKHLHQVPAHDLERIKYVFETIKKVKRELHVPLIGFCGGPYTVAHYACPIEEEKKNPSSLHRLLEKITQASIEYLRLQIESGAEVVQVFDSWAGLLPKEEFLAFSLPYLKQIVDQIKPLAPVIVFTRGSSHLVDPLVSISPSAISYDWQEPIHALRKKTPREIAVQGNLNPESLKKPLPLLEQEVKHILESMKGEKGFIFNLGHGVQPDTPVGAVQLVVDLIKNHS